MRKFIFLALFVAIVTGCVYAQGKFSFEIGNVTNYEMTMTEYDKDPNAEAVVIYELGYYSFQGDDDTGYFLFHKNKKIKIKILKQAGVSYANFEIPIYQENHVGGSLIVNKATVYNSDELSMRKTELDKRKIYEERINKNWVIKKFTMPDVHEGSVIEIDYTVITPYIFNIGTWEFQKSIPVVYSRLKYMAVPYYEYAFIMKGASKFDEYSSVIVTTDIHFRNLMYKEVEYIFGMKDVPAFKDEEFITSPQDYMISLDFQLSKMNYPTGGSRDIMKTWPQLNTDFMKSKNFGDYIKDTEKKAKAILQGLSLAGLSQQEQLEKIVHYVKSMYGWNGYIGKYSSKSVNNFLKEKTGNAADINLFLIGLLKAAGINTEPVLLSTRTGGAVSHRHPFEHFFNYVIALVKIDNQTFFIDATDPMLPNTKLPERCVNVEGLIVKPKTEEWIFTQQKNTAISQWNFSITPIPDEHRSIVEATNSVVGPYAYRQREIYTNEGQNKFTTFLTKMYNINPDNITSIQNENDFEKPFIFSIAQNMSLETNENKLYIHPFCNLSLSTNMFRQTTRTLPVDLIYSRGDKYRTLINIPEGYKVSFLPAPRVINNSRVSMKYTVEVIDGNKVEINADYLLRKDIYEAKEYAELKADVATVIEKLSEIVVLEKE